MDNEVAFIVSRLHASVTALAQLVDRAVAVIHAQPPAPVPQEVLDVLNQLTTTVDEKVTALVAVLPRPTPS